MVLGRHSHLWQHEWTGAGVQSAHQLEGPGDQSDKKVIISIALSSKSPTEDIVSIYVSPICTRLFIQVAKA